MPLIKNSNATRVARDAVVLDLGDLQREADRIIEDARRQADEILADAKREAQRLIDAADAKGHEQGFARGVEEGREQGRAEGREETKQSFQDQFEQLTAGWREAIDRWEADRNAMILAARDDVLAFAFELGRKLVFRQAAIDPTVIRDQLAEALGLMTDASRATVWINPDDRATVEQVLPDVLEQIERSTEVELREHASMHRGGCVVRTARGTVDARIESQLDRIVAALLPARDQRDEGDSAPDDGESSA
jgi:flagellar biosynthesis/type III secretory pathway protein FliH